ncbi:hypothetical protein [Micromonospora globbae]|uniref:hypothetical protein n=1 Tax=Micromonospora globbae TaxID=1894969 RepID=UPI003865F8C8|nr:hypothetical protein OH732_21905 [Micromonospora globbae]
MTRSSADDADTSTPRTASAHRPPSGPVSCTPMSSTAVPSSVPSARSSCWARTRKFITWRWSTTREAYAAAPTVSPRRALTAPVARRT